MSISRTARLAAYRVLFEYKIARISLDNLIFIFEENGFDVIDYSAASDNSLAQSLLEKYSISTLAKQSTAFLFVQGDEKYVFLNENLSVQEKTYALAHELGHVRLNHVQNGTFPNGSFQQEQAANEFVHYLLSPAFYAIVWVWSLNHRLLSALIALLVVGGIVVYPIASYVESRTYHGGYYVTPHGTHYHVKDCYTIYGHEVHEMTEEEYKSGEYQPCSICIK